MIKEVKQKKKKTKENLFLQKKKTKLVEKKQKPPRHISRPTYSITRDDKWQPWGKASGCHLFLTGCNNISTTIFVVSIDKPSNVAATAMCPLWWQS